MKDEIPLLSQVAPVPLRALGISVLALAIPMVGVTLAPGWLSEEQELLLWLTALVPPFLLTYHRGWKGATLSLAGGMAALVLAHLALTLMGTEVRSYVFLLWITATYIAVCVGAGMLAELLRRERQATEEMALTDALTGLPNRRHAMVFMDAAFSAATRGQPMSVVFFDFFDLDHFKHVNARFGRRSGDAVLKRVGAVLRDVTRHMDLSARWGGEEFLSVLSRCPGAGATSFAERVQSALRAEVFPWGTVTVSAGIAEFEPGMGSPELLVAAADQALHAAKEGGRNRCVLSEIRVAAAAESPSERAGAAPAGAAHGIRTGAPGDGTPVVTAEGAETGRDLPGGSERILVVDDNESAREAIVRILGRLGYAVAEAEDGAAALVLTRDGKAFDLLVTDLIMPGIGGFTLAERVEDELGPQRILYMSGEVQADVSWRGAPGSTVAFLEKPMTGADLARGVRALLDLPRGARAGEDSPER